MVFVFGLVVVKDFVKEVWICCVIVGWVFKFSCGGGEFDILVLCVIILLFVIIGIS